LHRRLEAVPHCYSNSASQSFFALRQQKQTSFFESSRCHRRFSEYHPVAAWSVFLGEISDVMRNENEMIRSPVWSLKSVMRAIIALLQEPNADSPLNCDAGNLIRSGDVRGFRSMAKMYTVEHALKKREITDEEREGTSD
jgi:hypothetical protein